MVDYVDGVGLILHPDDIGTHLKQPVFDQCTLPPVDRSMQVLLPYFPTYAIDQPSTSRDVCVAPLEEIHEIHPGCSQPQEYYQIEEPPREDEIFEEITRARCIDCDRTVDMGPNGGAKKHACELVKKHSCQHCGARFNFPPNLVVHRILQHTPQASFTAGTDCELCDNKAKRKFQRFNAYLAHVKTHVRSETYACSNCGEEFEFVNLYNRHRRIAHGIGETTQRRGYSSELGYCNKCYKLLELTKVDAHRLTHAVHLKIERKEKSREKASESQKQSTAPSKKKYECAHCDKAFVRPAELKRHQAVHDKFFKLKCPSCDKSFSHQAGLSAHQKVAHSTQKPKFSCTICGLAFSKRSNVERHVKTVHPLSTKQETFDCMKCTCQFKTAGALSKHLRLAHNEEKPSYQCQPCGKAFTVLGSYRNHQMIHAEVSDYPHHCNKCNKRFKLRSSLKLHLDVHQRKEIDDPVLTDPKCPICLKHLSSKNNLRRHLLTHQNFYECPDCCQKFSSIHRLDRHRCFKNMPTMTTFPQDLDLNMADNRQTIVPAKSYYCKQCPSSFYSFKAFKEHKSLHLGLKPHLCWTCHKAFRTADLLALHKEIHSREPMYCEYCPMVLNGRIQYSAHVRAVHQHGSLDPMTTIQMQKQRDIEISSSQSFPNADPIERGGMTTGFPTRAQSVDADGREVAVVESWHQMAPPETVADRPLRCPICFHLFDSVAHLSQHFANTQDDRDHSFSVIPCPICELSLRGSGEAASHFAMVHVYMEGAEINRNGVPVFVAPEEVTYVESRPSSKVQQCHMCPSKFQKPSDLERHMRTHTGERPFECDVCSRSFSLRSSLTSHMKTHNRGEPEQLCTVCGSQFYNKNALVLHMRIHSGEKPLRCRFCPLNFRTSAGRQQHERSAHNATIKNCSGRCRNRGCPNCSTGKRARIAMADSQIESEFPPFDTDLTDAFDPNMAVVDEGFVFADTHFEPKSAPPPKDKGALIMDTLAQISRIDGLPLEPAKSSAFARAAPNPSSAETQIFIHITARRISLIEYSVTVSKLPPKAIREGIDTTSSIPFLTLQDLSEQGTPMRLALMDNQQLNVMPKGILEALGPDETVVLRAHPMNPEMRSCVELVPPHHTEFCSRCEICEVDLPTKEISDAHFASEDHETAQVLHPLAEAVQDTIHDNLMATTTVSHHRREEVTCKLCGRKFLDTEPLVAHIRLEHERDHPHSLAPRPIARTAPPLEATRESF